MGLSRRDLLKATTALATVGASGIGFARGGTASRATEAGEDAPLRLWYPRPATQWVEALPLGNGRLGAMVWGGARNERIQLNEDTLYAGGPYDADPDGALAALPRVRELLFAGKYAQAEALANAGMMGAPLKQMPYQPLAELVLDFLEVSDIDGYRRELDLASAVATSTFRSRGRQHRREVLVSPAHQVVAVRLSGDMPGGISLRIALETDQAGATIVPGDGSLLLQGRNAAAFGIEGRLRYVLGLRVVHHGGRMQSRGDRIEVRDADEVMLLLAAATSYRTYQDVGGDPEALVRAHLESACGQSWESLREAHVTAHATLFGRVSIDLGRSDPAISSLPTDARVARFGEGRDPELAALYHQYGRYLLIASSRVGSQPANLQGIWNDLLSPPWESKYTININTEMNYWPSEANALPECVEPLERMLFDLAAKGAVTARRMYGAPGWVAHHNTDLWRQAAPVDGARWGLWPMGGAWLLQQLWERWDYGRDLAYLRKVWPLFKGAAEFHAATLVEDPHTRAMVTAPSLSPENQHPFGAALCAGPSMDAQLLRDLFGQCIEASRLLGVDAVLAKQLASLRERLPPHRVGKAGQLQEWQEDWDMDAPELRHRHVSHLYALHPSAQVNVRDTPGLAAAARRSLEIRGDEATGWGTAWRLNLWARLRDGEHAYKVLGMLLSPQRTYPNLFDAHPPFQIDGNFGGTAGITEMLLQSWGGTIFLLPALPAAWPEGALRGARVRGAAGVDLEWKDGLLARATLRSDKGGEYELGYRDQVVKVALHGGESAQVRLRRGRLVRA